MNAKKLTVGVKAKPDPVCTISCDDFRAWEDRVAKREGRTAKKRLHPWLPAKMDVNNKRK